MKKLLSLVLLICAVCCMTAGAATVSLVAPPASDGPFDVLVNVTGVFDPPHDLDFLLGYGFDVLFDSSKLTYLGETAGALFTDLSGTPGLTADVAGVATAVLLGPGDFSEPLTLATLHFDVLGRGPSSISITGDPLNLDQGLIYLTGSDAISASTDVTATPEPGVLLLLSSGLMALVGGRLVRRQRA